MCVLVSFREGRSRDLFVGEKGGSGTIDSFKKMAWHSPTAWQAMKNVRSTGFKPGQDSEILGGSSDADLAVSDDSEEPVGLFRRVERKDI